MDYFYITLEIQLFISRGKNIEVATDTALFEGILSRVENDIIELVEDVVGYERETRRIIIPISSINFVRVNRNEGS